MVRGLHEALIESPRTGIVKKMPLSKLPSPNCSELTFVFEAKTPNLIPLLNVLDNSIVVPTSPAKYSPKLIFASNGMSE